MNSVLSKLFMGDKSQALKQILQIYKSQHFCIVNYLYFAPIVAQHLFDKSENEQQKKFKQAVLDWDFLLPDGIALQIFYRLASLRGKIKWPKSRLKNLNGTDFFPYAIHEIKKAYGENINFILYAVHDKSKGYGTSQNQLKKKRIDAIQKHFALPVTYYYESEYKDESYTDFDFTDMEKYLKPDAINILMVTRGMPRQEIRAFHNKENIKKYKILVFNQWATIDFLCGFEKRAPKFIIALKLERLRRIILNPQRNRKKVLDSLTLFRYIFKYLIS